MKSKTWRLDNHSHELLNTESWLDLRRIIGPHDKLEINAMLVHDMSTRRWAWLCALALRNHVIVKHKGSMVLNLSEVVREASKSPTPQVVQLLRVLVFERCSLVQVVDNLLKGGKV